MKDAVVVVPVGSIEQHGPHLPVSTDAVCAERLVDLAVNRLAATVTAVVVPTIRYGFSHDHLGFPGTLSISHRLLEDLLVEIGVGILRTGYRRIVFVNGHGSNDRLLYYAVRQIRDSGNEPAAVAGVTYWKLAAADIAACRLSPVGGMGHACELETSLMLAFEPETVDMGKAVREIPKSYSAYRGDDLLASGPVVAPDRFADRTRTGVMGDPTFASAKHGRELAEIISRRLAAFLDEFATWPVSSEST
jgi:creatinine amidohydrolase